MYEKKVLDHGFVKLLNVAGPTRRIHNGPPGLQGNDLLEAIADSVRPFDADDIDPSQAARMSFEQFNSDRTYEADMKLSAYLLRNLHTSPFEMISVWLEVKVPIFVDRQWVRHRMWRRNESSGRYIQLPREWYIPETVGGKASNKKQGQEDNLSSETQAWFREMLDEQCERGYNIYETAIQRGVAPEHARMFLHLNHYVHWVGNVDLGNMFRFLMLRDHAHAQIEAQLYARAIIELLEPHLPGLLKLFKEIIQGK